MEGRARQRFETLNKGPRWREDRRNDRSHQAGQASVLNIPQRKFHLLTSRNFAQVPGLAKVSQLSPRAVVTACHKTGCAAATTARCTAANPATSF